MNFQYFKFVTSLNKDKDKSIDFEVLIDFLNIDRLFYNNKMINGMSPTSIDVVKKARESHYRKLQ
jgi:hypothetical protein